MEDKKTNQIETLRAIDASAWQVAFEAQTRARMAEGYARETLRKAEMAREALFAAQDAAERG